MDGCRFVSRWLPLRGVKRRRHGDGQPGTTPAMEELDHSQEAEGKIFIFIQNRILYFHFRKEKIHLMQIA